MIDMSAYTTKYISRDEALLVLLTELPRLSREVLEDLLNRVANSGESTQLGTLYNYVVSETTR